MLQVIQSEMISFQFPKEYLPDVIAILKSGTLSVRNDKVILHFDNRGLRIIEKSDKFVLPI